MLKLIIVNALLCALMCTAYAEENATIVKEIKLSKAFSRTIVDDSHLLILASNRTHVLINSTDEQAKPCILEVDRVEHPIQKNIRAAKLGDKIIVWGVRSQYKIGRRTRMDYTFIIVDPKQCTYKPLSTYEEEFLWLFDINQNLPEVVTHGDSFDVIYSTARVCAPCRYSKDGKRLDVKLGIEAEPLEPSSLTHVKTFDSIEVKNGYLYAHNYNSRKSVMKLYDNNFNVIKQKNFEHPVDVAEISSGEHSNIITCYLTSIRVNPLNDRKVNCERFDGNFKSVFSIDLPLLEKHDPASISLAVDSSGNSFVSVVESDESEDIDVFRRYKINPTGQVISTIKLGEMPRQKYYGNYQLRGFIFNEQYCFETTKTWPMWAYPSDADEHESVKCIAI